MVLCKSHNKREKQVTNEYKVCRTLAVIEISRLHTLYSRRLMKNRSTELKELAKKGLAKCLKGQLQIFIKCIQSYPTSLETLYYKPNPYKIGEN